MNSKERLVHRLRKLKDAYYCTAFAVVVVVVFNRLFKVGLG